MICSYFYRRHQTFSPIETRYFLFELDSNYLGRKKVSHILTTKVQLVFFFFFIQRKQRIKTRNNEQKRYVILIVIIYFILIYLRFYQVFYLLNTIFVNIPIVCTKNNSLYSNVHFIRLLISYLKSINFS